jgi:transglutaminase/protease-like cytokinesis protein 3
MIHVPCIRAHIPDHSKEQFLYGPLDSVEAFIYAVSLFLDFFNLKHIALTKFFNGKMVYTWCQVSSLFMSTCTSLRFTQ